MGNQKTTSKTTRGRKPAGIAKTTTNADAPIATTLSGPQFRRDIEGLNRIYEAYLASGRSMASACKALVAWAHNQTTPAKTTKTAGAAA